MADYNSSYTGAQIDEAIGDVRTNKGTWNGKSGKALSFTVTLTANGWSNNAQTVSNANFVASGYAYTVCPSASNYTAYADAQIYADDVTTNGSMTFHCASAPTGNLTVNVLRVEVQ